MDEPPENPSGPINGTMCKQRRKRYIEASRASLSTLWLVICLLDALNFAPPLPLSDPDRTLDLELEWKLAVGAAQPTSSQASPLIGVVTSHSPFRQNPATNRMHAQPKAGRLTQDPPASPGDKSSVFIYRARGPCPPSAAAWTPEG